MLWIFPQEEAEQVWLTIAVGAQQVGWTNTRAIRTVSPTVVNGNPLAIEVGRDRERGIFPLVHTRKLPHTAVDKHKKNSFCGLHSSKHLQH